MKNKEILNRLKNQKGIMTVYVTVMVLTFVIILTTIFSAAIATRKNELKTLIKIKEVYEQNNNKIQEIDQNIRRNVI